MSDISLVPHLQGQVAKAVDLDGLETDVHCFVAEGGLAQEHAERIWAVIGAVRTLRILNNKQNEVVVRLTAEANARLQSVRGQLADAEDEVAALRNAIEKVNEAAQEVSNSGMIGNTMARRVWQALGVYGGEDSVIIGNPDKGYGGVIPL